jgi:N-methylhydantoinase A
VANLGTPDPRAAATIGIDLGGTFVDCVVVRSDDVLAESKSATTAEDPVVGIMAALRAAAEASGTTLAGLLGQAGALVHGTTLGLNAILDRSGGRVGLLTTRGHEDALAIGRVHQKVAGLRPDEITRVSELRKPTPLVPRWDIVGIHERIDAAGTTVVALDEHGVVQAARKLIADGCQALAVAFLWSHLRPEHERRAAALIEAALPGTPVVCSSDVAPVLGEYERTAAAVIDAMLLGPFRGYLARLASELRAGGFRGEAWLMGMAGGVIPWDTAATRPIETLRSGPVGGIIATTRLSADHARHGVVATDMGGTSFDVGLVPGGDPIPTETTLVGQFHIALPSVEVRSIGAGGGSIAWLDDSGVHVGPRSAGASPGPACYGRGGTAPTVTDADLVLGRLDASTILGGRIRLDRDLAERAIAPLAAQLGMDVVRTAAGIIRVADAQMANLIRTSALERGHDLRHFGLVAYGGAGPQHVGAYGADLGVDEALIPASASVFSALGLATADYRRTYRRSIRLRLPVEPGGLDALAGELGRAAIDEHATSGFGGEPVLAYWVGMRYRRQTHHLRTPLPVDGQGRVVDRDVATAFESLYARTFGPGAGYAAAGIEIVSVGVDVVAARSHDDGDAVTPRTDADARRTERRSRPVWFDGWHDTPILTGRSLEQGQRIDGPAIVEWGSTSVVVHPGQNAMLDRHHVLHLRYPVGAVP